MLFLFVFWIACGCGLAAISYTPHYTLNPIDAALQKQLEDASYLSSLKDHHPDTLEELHWRAERDKIQLAKLLASNGYMNSCIDIDIKQQSSDKELFDINVNIKAGKVYTYSSILVDASDTPAWFKASIVETENMREGAQVNYEHIQRTQQKLEKEAKEKGHPWAVCDKPILEVDNAKATVSLVFPMTFGQQSKMGATTIQGLQHVDATYVRNRLAWKEGDTFDQNLIDKTRETLIATTLFAEVDIQISPRSGANNITDVTLHLKEGAARSIGAGLRYATSEGIGGRIFWRHKNIGGKAQSLEFSARRTKLQTRAEIKWDVPDFWIPQQTLSNALFTSMERQRAYHGRIYGSNILLGRDMWTHSTGKLGFLVDHARLRQDEMYYRSKLVGVPVQLNLDGSNSLLDPSEGIRLSGWATPYWGHVNETGRGFVSTRFQASGYLPLSSAYKGSDPVVVLAGFARLGKILSKGLYYVPPHQRFYAGGADSVRAYGPQMLGSLDSNNVPTGGLFLTEYGGEVRLRTSETMGLVAFAEAGTLTSNGLSGAFDQLKAKPLWGTGLGFRYYTPLGPIRADLAFPMSRRKDANHHKIDSPFQFYISFGQAF